MIILYNRPICNSSVLIEKINFKYCTQTQVQYLCRGLFVVVRGQKKKVDCYLIKKI